MALFRTKPVQTRYVHALLDESTDEYFVQDAARDGSAQGPITKVARDAFEHVYEPVVRKPRKEKAVAHAPHQAKNHRSE